MLSFYMHIPDPENLSNYEFNEKWEQLIWVMWFDKKLKNFNGKEIEL